MINRKTLRMLLPAMALTLCLGVAVAQETKAESPFAANSGAAAAPAQAQGQLKFVFMDHDYGEILEGEVVDLKFPVTNPTDKVIKISRVQTTCGCTSAKDNPKEIGPGETVDIKVSYNSAGRGGRQAKTVSVWTDEGPGVQYQLSFAGTAREDIFPKDRIVRGAAIPTGIEGTETFSILTFTDPPTKLTSITSPDVRLRFEAQEPVSYTHTDGRKGYELPVKVSIPSDYPVGAINTNVVVHTDNAKKPQIMIPFNSMVEGRFKVVPPRILLGRVSPGAHEQGAVMISSTSQGNFEIVSAELDSDFPGKATITAANVAHAKNIMVEFDAPQEAGNISGMLTIRAKMGDSIEEMSVPVRAFVRPPDVK